MAEGTGHTEATAVNATNVTISNATINVSASSGESEEELLAMSSLNLGARTLSVDESARKQSDVRRKGKPGFFRKIFEGTARRNVDASSVQAARTEDKQPTASGVNRPERTGSTFPEEIETVDALMEDSKFKKAIDLLERLPQTQDQQMKLLECYDQLGRNSEVLKCIENMRNLVARHPRPNAVDIYQLGLDNLEKSYHIKAIAYFACAAKIYSFESNADEAVRRMCVCSLKSSDAVEAMFEQNKLVRLFARDVGMEIINSIYCDVTKVSNANPDLKAEMEADCLFIAGFCYGGLELYEKAIEVCKNGIDVMNRQFGGNSSKYTVFGGLLNNMGAVYDDVKYYSKAASLYERSIDAKQLAEDWPNDEAKKKSIEGTENRLRRVRRKMK